MLLGGAEILTIKAKRSGTSLSSELGLCRFTAILGITNENEDYCAYSSSGGRSRMRMASAPARQSPPLVLPPSQKGMINDQVGTFIAA